MGLREEEETGRRGWSSRVQRHGRREAIGPKTLALMLFKQGHNEKKKKTAPLQK
jgi:hypothetical protein